MNFCTHHLMVTHHSLAHLSLEWLSLLVAAKEGQDWFWCGFQVDTLEGFHNGMLH